MSSTKSLTGHLLEGAAGAIEAIYSVKAIAESMTWYIRRPY